MRKTAVLIFAAFFLTAPVYAGVAGFSSSTPVAVKRTPRMTHVKPIPPLRPVHSMHGMHGFYRPYSNCTSFYISNKNGYTVRQYSCYEPYFRGRSIYITPGIQIVN